MRWIINLVTLISLSAGTASADLIWNSPAGTAESAPRIDIIGRTAGSLTIEVNVDGIYVENLYSNQGDYYRLRLAEMFEGTTQDVGMPELPVISHLIEIPSTAIPQVQILSSETAVFENITPYPYQTPATDDGAPGAFEVHPDAYVSASIYPPELASVENIGVWRHLQVGSLKINPVQYLASENRLILTTALTLKINFEMSAVPPFDKPQTAVTPAHRKMYQNSILNYDPQAHITPELDEPAGVKYLIITEDRAIDYIQPLADLRNAQGLRTEIRISEPGFDTAVDFKLYISSLYLSDGLEYVLMVGDPYIGTGTPEVPMYYWTFNPANPSHSDSWYTCLVPGSDSDHYPEIAVGRITYDNTTELATMIDKTLLYLTEPDMSEDWFEKTLLVAHGENYPLKYTQCKEEVRTFGYALQTPVFTTIYGGAGGSNTSIINYINSGSCGLFNYRGHGSETTWPGWGGGGSFTSYWINQFTNSGRPFVLFDVCCSNNNLVTYNGGCLVESFMQTANGAVAVHGASEPSYTDPNHVFDKEFYKAIYNNGITSIGYASNYAAMETMDDFGGLGMDNFRMYFWQGDPAIDLWTQTPADPEVDILNSVAIGGTVLSLDVTLSGLGFENALVCLQNDEIYTVGYTDAAGHCDLAISPPAFLPGEVYLTVSGHNLAFHCDTLDIEGGLGSVDGTVYRNDNSDPIDSALVEIPAMMLETYTDEIGYYSFAQVPAEMDQNIYVSHPDYLPAVEEGMQLTIGEHRTIDFNLYHAECVPALDEIAVVCDSGAAGFFDFTVSNPGDGPLDYTVEITGQMSGPLLYQRYYFDATAQNGDEELYGAAFDGEYFWLTGEGDAQYNWLYKHDLEGNLVETIPQPMTSSDHGFYDICWDGQYLYGSEASDIICFDTAGNYIYTIPTPLTEIRAITIDPGSGHFFIGNGSADIREIDSLGTVFDTYNHDNNVTGLCWNADDADGYYLYLLSSEPAITITKLNLTERETAIVGSIFGMPDNVSAGCVISSEVNPIYQLFVGLVKTPGSDKVKGWQLDRLFDHFALSPMEGTIDPAMEQNFTLDFDASLLEPDVYDAILRFTHNGFGQVTDVPVTLYAGVSAVSDLSVIDVPQTFALKQNYPNPFNAQTAIGFTVPLKSPVELSVYDVLGRTVAEWKFGSLDPGEYTQSFDASALSSGIYFYRLNSGDYRTAKKMLLLK